MASKLASKGGGGKTTTIIGTDGADQLVGTRGNDVIDGRGGADTMRGGTGNDIYHVDNLDDVVVELAGEGTDEVRSTVEHTLSENVEALTLLGPATNGYGNASDNRITGNDLANTLHGLAGSDFIVGGAGDDTLVGGTGGDHLDGGAGNDVFYVDDPLDFVFERTDDGNDTVYSAINYQLSFELENLTLIGNAYVGTGNYRDNVIVGNALNNLLTGNEGNDRLLGDAGSDELLGGLGQDVLEGGLGNDVLDGGAGADSMSGGPGDDVYHVDDAGDVTVEYADAGTDHVFSSVTYGLTWSFENLTLTGTAAIRADGTGLDNVITGNSAANIINGSWGADTMSGGGGDDTYYVHDAGDIVIENAGEGTDVVTSIVSFVLSDHVEQLYLLGGAAIDATGNDLANYVYGNDGANQISGRGGSDILWGGAGADTFVFDTALDRGSNVDFIIDFTSADDTIALDQSIFSALTATGTLDPSAFRAGTAAQDADDRIIYDSATGNLYYDADGNGAGASILFAQTAAGIALTSADFLIVG